MSTFFQDSSGEIRLVGTLYSPGATTGDVLTVQSNGSLAPAPGGGSLPSNYALGKTILDFQETTGAGTYTAEVTIPAGAMISDVRCYVLDGPWDADTASLDVGDDDEPQGFIKTNQLCVYGDLTGTGYNALTNGTAGQNYNSWAHGGSNDPQGDYDRNNAFGTDNNDAGVRYPTQKTLAAVVVTTGAGGTTGHLAIEVFGYGLPAETINAVKS